MLARLALLLQNRPPYGTSVFTVEIVDEAGEMVRNLYSESLTEALGLEVEGWSDAAKAAQAIEIGSLLKSIARDGVDGFDLRDEGGFAALPPAFGSRRRWKELPVELLAKKDQHLKGIPALRVYCEVFGESLILFYACCKTKRKRSDCEFASQFGDKSSILAPAIDVAIANGDLVYSSGHLDGLQSLSFTIPDNS